MGTKYGVEIEFFVIDKRSRKPVLLNQGEDDILDNIGHDEYPVLGEVRSSVYEEVYLAVVDALYRFKNVQNQLQDTGYEAHRISSMPLTREIWEQVRRAGGKKCGVSERNLYGDKIKRPMNSKVITAGLHIHFSNGETYDETCDCRCKRKYTIYKYAQVDIPHMVLQLDKKFKRVIERAGRQCGWYELKNYGFEYRSLPNSVDVNELIDFVHYKLEW